ncbi:MAG: protease inhibitor I42 family protein [bacterium]
MNTANSWKRSGLAMALTLAAGAATEPAFAGETDNAMTTKEVVSPAAGAAIETHAVALMVGETLPVTLRCYGGTGYSWNLQPAPTDTVLKKTSETTGPVEPVKPGLVGGPMETRIVWQATGSGQATLVYELRRPWEKGVPPARQVTIEVSVAAVAGAQ